MLGRIASVCLVAGVAAAIAGCAIPTADQSSIGKALRGGDVPVYIGGISARYTVVKQLSETRRQICGPNYYDGLSGSAWLAAAAKSVGANAVINYSDEVTGKSLFSCGEFTARGTAVRIAK